MTTLEPGARLVFTHGLRVRPRSTAFLASSPAPIITAGFDVFVHEVMAAITTAPWSISTVSPSIVSSTAVRVDRRRQRRRVARVHRLPARLVDRAVALADPERRQRRRERVARLAQRDPVLRAPRPCDRGLDGGEVELDDLRVRRLLLGVVPEPVLLAVRLDERDLVVAASGEPEVAERLVVDGEEPARRAVLGRHVPDRGPVGERQADEPVAEVLDELPDHAGLPQDLR